MANMEYINSLDVEQLRRQLAHALDVKHGLIYALKNWPELPPPFVLKYIRGNFPDDWERGKAMQRELTLDVVPPKTECEIGAGFWDRITEGKWADVKPPAKPDK